MGTGIYSLRNNLALLNKTIGVWNKRGDILYKRYKKSKEMYHKKSHLIDMGDSIDNHILRLVYTNYVKPFVASYFMNNYYWLSTDKVENEDLSLWPFLIACGDVKQTKFNNITKTYNELVSWLHEDELKAFILETWNEVSKEIESYSLPLWGTQN